MGTDDLVTQGARASGIRDLFTSDTRRMLDINICNYDFWKHAHIHMTAQKQMKSFRSKHHLTKDISEIHEPTI